MQEQSFPSGMRAIQRNRRGPMSRQRRTTSSRQNRYTTSTHGDEDDKELLIDSVLVQRNGASLYKRRKDYAPLRGDDLISDEFHGNTMSIISPFTIFEVPPCISKKREWLWRLSCVMFGVTLYMSFVSLARGSYNHRKSDDMQLEELLSNLGSPKKTANKPKHLASKIRGFKRSSANTVVDVKFDNNDDMVYSEVQKSEQRAKSLRGSNAFEIIHDDYVDMDGGIGKSESVEAKALDANKSEEKGAITVAQNQGQSSVLAGNVIASTPPANHVAAVGAETDMIHGSNSTSSQDQSQQVGPHNAEDQSKSGGGTVVQNHEGAIVNASVIATKQEGGATVATDENVIETAQDVNVITNQHMQVNETHSAISQPNNQTAGDPGIQQTIDSMVETPDEQTAPTMDTPSDAKNEGPGDMHNPDQTQIAAEVENGGIVYQEAVQAATQNEPVSLQQAEPVLEQNERGANTAAQQQSGLVGAPLAKADNSAGGTVNDAKNPSDEDQITQTAAVLVNGQQGNSTTAVAQDLPIPMLKVK